MAACRSAVVPQIFYAKELERAGGTDHDAAELDRDERLEEGCELCPCGTGSGNERWLKGVAKPLEVGLEK